MGMNKILFFKNDVKADWWQQDGDGQTSDKQGHELLFEFKDKSKQKVWFYTIDRLTFKSNKYLDVCF
jgi:hypothetical protein